MYIMYSSRMNPEDCISLLWMFLNSRSALFQLWLPPSFPDSHLDRHIRLQPPGGARLQRLPSLLLSPPRFV